MSRLFPAIVLVITLQLLSGYMAAQTPGRPVVIKTDLLADGIAQNPNLAVEKSMNDRYSVEVAGYWLRRDRAGTGGEKTANRYRDSKGFALMLAGKRFLGKKTSSPQGYYLSLFFRYNSTTIDNLEQVSSTSGMYERTIRLYRRGPEPGLLFGRQFSLFGQLMLDLNGGLGHYWRNHRETLLAGQPHSDYVNGVYNTRFNRVRPYCRVQLGWMIGK